MSTLADRQRIMRKIERVLFSFQRLLKFGVRPAMFLPEPDGVDPELLELSWRNAHRFLFVSQILVSIYVAMKTNTYKTKRCLFYKYKHLFVNQSALDSTIELVTRVLQECRFDLHILATSKGLVVGDLVFKVKTVRAHGNASGIVDCRDIPVSIPILPTEIIDIRSNATFILVAEKDAIFQCLVAENARQKLGPCIIVTAKGYPDYGTRIFLHRLYSQLRIPVFALTDADPYGVDIYMTYKYGSLAPHLYEVYDISLPRLRWIGVWPTETASLPLAETSRLPLTARERNRATHLIFRSRAMREDRVTEELRYMLQIGYKAEIEAVVALGQGFLSGRYLISKLAHMRAEQ